MTCLRAFDFSRFKPHKITFENCYMEDGDDNREKPRYEAFKQFLLSLGYRVEAEDHEDTTVVLSDVS